MQGKRATPITALDLHTGCSTIRFVKHGEKRRTAAMGDLADVLKAIHGSGRQGVRAGDR
jgi:hypothetical protein